MSQDKLFQFLLVKFNDLQKKYDTLSELVFQITETFKTDSDAIQTAQKTLDCVSLHLHYNPPGLPIEQPSPSKSYFSLFKHLVLS